MWQVDKSRRKFWGIRKDEEITGEEEGGTDQFNLTKLAWKPVRIMGGNLD